MLISRVPVSGILVGLGVLLVVAAVAVEVLLHRRRPGVVPAVVVLVGGLAALVAPGGCDEETVYHCAEIVADDERDGGRLLLLDGVGHSYVDLDDPTHLEFDYVQSIASLIDTAYPSGEALTGYHLGAGGLTVPRYLDVVRPGTTSLVSEIDPGWWRSTPSGWGWRPGSRWRCASRTAASVSNGCPTRRTTWSSATPSAASPCPGT